MSETTPEKKQPEESSRDGGVQDPNASFDQLMGGYAERSGMARGANGQVDVLKSIGGWRGLAESILPGLVFLVMFTVGGGLQPSLIASLAVAGVFTILRLLQKTPLTQALAGLFGVGICAYMANRTGNAADYYIWGFFTNAAYIAAMVLSIAVKWPLMGLLFGFIRGEGTHWRRDGGRRRIYAAATLVMIAVLALRLVVQVPLYFAENLVALGTTRLIMGLPLYALGLWLAWSISRPADKAGTAGP